MPATKIAACCYCGAKTALALRGNQQHTLACDNCGAPLSRMKSVPRAKTAAPAQRRRAPKPDWHVPHGHPYDMNQQRGEGSYHAPPPRPKRWKSFGKLVLDGVFDVIEEIFD